MIPRARSQWGRSNFPRINGIRPYQNPVSKGLHHQVATAKPSPGRVPPRNASIGGHAVVKTAAELCKSFGGKQRVPLVSSFVYQLLNWKTLLFINQPRGEGHPGIYAKSPTMGAGSKLVGFDDLFVGGSLRGTPNQFHCRNHGTSDGSDDSLKSIHWQTVKITVNLQQTIIIKSDNPIKKWFWSKIVWYTPTE